MIKFLGLLMMFVPVAVADATVPSLEDLLTNAEVRHSIPKGMLRAMAMVESRMNPKVFLKYDGKGGQSAFGLMQLHLVAARDVGYRGPARGLMDVQTNIDVAARYLVKMTQKCRGNWVKGVKAYNRGVSYCAQGVERDYANDVLSNMLSSK